VDAEMFVTGRTKMNKDADYFTRTGKIKHAFTLYQFKSSPRSTGDSSFITTAGGDQSFFLIFFPSFLPHVL
jgi:hypothetical protein